MTGILDDNLEQRLVELTAWPGGKRQVWQQALKAAQGVASSSSSRWRSAFMRMMSWKVAASAAVLALIVTAVAVNVPDRLHSGRDAARGRGLGSALYTHAGDDSGVIPEQLAYPSRHARTEVAKERARVTAGQEYVRTPHDEAGRAYGDSMGTPVQSPVESSGTSKGSDRPVSDRHVIRKATIELKTDDVRAVFLKAAMVLNAARGEYVEGSELTGTGKEAQAHLTLRVAADRLDDVLNQLRQLGEVRSERVEGQDVTAQVVDVEARLRNEQRVEAELLQLLEKRQDAPLKEVLELRDKIAQIREEIEKLTAQRDQLSRLVLLATVLVLIRPGDAPATYEPALGAYFVRKFKAAWTDGVQFLADTLATLVSIFVGGLIWWVIAAVVLVAAYRWRRRKSLAEPSG